MKNRIPFLPGWAVLSRSYAFKDIDSATAIEQTAKIYKAMQELIEDYNKFVEELNKSFEEHITLTEKDHECFKDHIDKICHDYIAVMDMHASSQDKIVDDAIKFMKDNLSQSISQVVAEMRASGEMGEVVLNGLEDIKNTLQTQASAIETNTNNISSNTTNISNNASAISELDRKVTQLDSGVGELDNRVGDLNNLNFAEIGGDTANVVASINAVHRRIDNEIETINETTNNLETNLNNLSGNVYVKNNYAVLEGDFTSGFSTPQYPEGFTMDNCVVLSCAIKYSGEDTMYQYLSQFDGDVTNSKVLKFVYAQVSSGIYITNTYKAVNEYSCHYKIVLLKYKD